MRKVGGGTIYTFDTDFGHYSKFNFSVGYTLGNSQVESTYFVSVFPNPSSGIYNLFLDNFTGDNLSLTIYNELGSLVYSDQQIENNPEGYLQEQIDLSSLQNGIYFVTITSENHTHTERIIKH